MNRTTAQHVHFKTLCTFISSSLKTTTCNDKTFGVLRTEFRCQITFIFHLELIAVRLQYAEVDLWHRKRRETLPAICEILTKIKIRFINRRPPRRALSEQKPSERESVSPHIDHWWRQNTGKQMITYSCVSIDGDRVYFVYITVMRELTSTLIAAFELKSRATCAVVSTSCVNTEMLAQCQTSSAFIFL